jgi:chemotaxis protein methyltransferase CheR
MAELGIVDIREIIRIIKTTHEYDFSNYALTSFKFRLEKIMFNHSITTTEGLIRKLHEEESFFDVFLHEISVPSTEMFRDPSIWRWLRDDYLPGMIDKNVGKLKIWLPMCVSGGELYTLAILLAESDMLDKVQITATCISQQSIELVKRGCYDLKKIEASEENYKRFNGTRELSVYYRLDKNCVIRDTALIENVEFRKVHINIDRSPQNVKLILYRNNLIYLNPSQQERTLRLLYDTLSVSGHLILGTKERITPIQTSRDFELVNESESIYRRRTLNQVHEL